MQPDRSLVLVRTARVLTTPPLGLVLVGAVLLTGSVLGARHLPAAPAVRLGWGLNVVVLTGLFALAEVVVVHVHVRRQRRTLSLSEVPLVLGLFLATPVTLIAARLVGAVIALVVHRHQRGSKLVLNLLLFSTEAVAALVVFRALLPHDARGPGGWLAGWAAVAAASWTSHLVVSALIAMHERALSVRAVLRDGTATMALGLGMATSGLLAASALAADARNAVLLAAVGGMLILAYRAYSSLSERHLALERLHRFGQALAASPEVDEVLRSLLVQARELLRAQAAEVTFLPDGDDGPGLRVRLLPDDTLERTVVDDLRSVDPLSARVVDTDRALLLGRGSEQTVVRYLDARGQREAVLVPLHGEAGTVGTLAVADRAGESGTFAREDIQLLQTVADSAAQALVQGRLLDQLRHGALHDALTGLPNRRQLLQVLEQLRDGADRRPYAVLLLDLNGFKAVNDAFGHERGDLLLQDVAVRVVAAVPERALVGRLGGDEFALVLPDVDGDVHARRIAEAVVAAVAHTVEHRGVALPVGTALGLCLAPRHGTDPGQLLRRADTAMYAAKRAGAGAVLWTADLDETLPVPGPRTPEQGSTVPSLTPPTGRRT